MTYIFNDKDIIKITITKKITISLKDKAKDKVKTKDKDKVKTKVSEAIGTPSRRIARLEIRDSISLLNSSLDALAKSYAVKTQKFFLTILLYVAICIMSVIHPINATLNLTLISQCMTV